MEIDKIIRKKVKNHNENQKFYSALFLKKTKPNINLANKTNKLIPIRI